MQARRGLLLPGTGLLRTGGGECGVGSWGGGSLLPPGVYAGTCRDSCLLSGRGGFPPSCAICCQEHPSSLSFGDRGMTTGGTPVKGLSLPLPWPLPKRLLLVV